MGFRCGARRRNPSLLVIARSVATWQSLPLCHCEERSDVAIQVSGFMPGAGLFLVQLCKPSRLAKKSVSALTARKGLPPGVLLHDWIAALWPSAFARNDKEVWHCCAEAHTTGGCRTPRAACNDALLVIARSEATRQSLPLCHCEERSDVAIQVSGFMPGAGLFLLAINSEVPKALRYLVSTIGNHEAGLYLHIIQ